MVANGSGQQKNFVIVKKQTRRQILQLKHQSHISLARTCLASEKEREREREREGARVR